MIEWHGNVLRHRGWNKLRIQLNRFENIMRYSYFIELSHPDTSLHVCSYLINKDRNKDQ